MPVLTDVAKPPDVYDDLESLYWVILYVAIERFGYRGHLPAALFDEMEEDVRENIGRVHVGGQRKRDWLGRPKLTFLCAELERALSLYRMFFSNYIGLATAPLLNEDEAARKRLEDFKVNLPNHIQQLKQVFDDVLDTDKRDWKQSLAHDAPPRPKGLRAHEMAVHRATEVAMGKGNWPGAYGYKRPGTSSLKELPEQATELEMPEIAAILELAPISEENEGDGGDHTKTLPPQDQVDQGPATVKPPRRRVPRVVEKSDRILRPRTQK